MIRISTSTNLLDSLPVHEAVRSIRVAGYQGVEVWASHFETTLTTGRFSREELISAIRKENLSVTVHAPHKGVNIASNDPIEREHSFSTVRSAVALTAQLGASILTVHPGTSTCPKNVLGFYEEHIKAFRPIVEAAQRTNISIAIENLEDPNNISNADDLSRILSMLEMQNVGVTLDIAHLEVAYPGEGWNFNEFPKVLNVHLSDTGPEKIHIPLGEGKLPIAKEVRKIIAAGYSGAVVIEGKMPSREQEIIRSNRRFLEQLLVGNVTS